MFCDLNLPEEFLTRVSQLFPESLHAQVAAAFTAEHQPTFRVNRLKQGVEAVISRLVADGLHPEPVPGVDFAFSLPVAERDLLTHHPLQADGTVYMQSLASMQAVLALDVQPGQEVLDTCAAPGGKTLLIADLLQNSGRLAAVEAVRPRFFKLKGQVEQAGAKVALYQTDARLLGKKVPKRFDRVLVDAPCSSESRMISGDPDTYNHWNIHKIHEVAHKQQGILAAAYQTLKPGGTMVYSTCSFAPEENEAQLTRLLDKHPELSVEPFDSFLPALPGLTSWQEKEFHPQCVNAKRIIPSPMTSGLFIAKIVDKGTGN